MIPKPSTEELAARLRAVTISCAPAGFELPATTKQQFLELHATITSTPKPPILLRLSSRKDWLTPFVNSALGHVQEGLAAAYYYLENVNSIEQQIISLALAALPDFQLPSGSCVGGGNTRRLDFEYQAFVFALRRTLEYLAVSVGMVFKSRVHSIRDLSKAIKNAEPNEVSTRVREKLEASLITMTGILPPDKETARSVRDRLAHWEAVSAGVFNITCGENGLEIFIAGGGENLRPWGQEMGVALSRQDAGGIAYTSLAPVLKRRLPRLRR